MSLEFAWGAPEWATIAIVFLAIGAASLGWSYWWASRMALSHPHWAWVAAALLKAAGLTMLALFLVEPLLRSERPRPGANLFVMAVDNSQSLQIRDPAATRSRGDALREELLSESSWQSRLGQDYEVRRFQIDSRLQSVNDFTGLSFDGTSSALFGSLAELSNRLRGLPVGGILLFTDGNSTEASNDRSPVEGLPRVFPVLVGSSEPPADLACERVSVSQSNFDAAPVVIRADARVSGGRTRRVIAQLIDDADQVVESQTQSVAAGTDVTSFRFQLRPAGSKVSFYTLRTRDADEVTDDNLDGETTREATLANNDGALVVDRGDGPYRVLYVCGRPNWDFKFLRRALEDDEQLELVALVRIADREPKFKFRRQGEGTGNKLFEGFRRDDADSAERHDEPVLLRLGTVDDQENRDGFPRTAEQLYQYHGLILDDIEAGFFSQDQMTLIENFVSRRGGGLLMAGGIGSFREGGYRRTPVGDLLPVYLDQAAGPSISGEAARWRLALSREGWLQPWTRLRETETEERQRLADMPPFHIVNTVGRIKPGAIELARVLDPEGAAHPALVAQRFGRGRAAAMLVGDLWRWAMRPSQPQTDDAAKAWRQVVRWLAADVPQRVEVEIEPDNVPDVAGRHQANRLRVQVSDPQYLPLDNAQVLVRVKTPEGREVHLRAEPGDRPGSYLAIQPARTPGAYRAAVEVTAPDGSEVGTRETGWVAEPLADEFERLVPDRDALAALADRTGGEVLQINQLDRFVRSLPNRRMPITEPSIRPLWHHPLFFLLAVACLVGEWALRRLSGLA
jgi:uncharacterized membrane protein